jgi:hypothetical protein
MGWSKQAVSFLDKIRGTHKFELTPEEKQTLNISDDIIEGLKNPQVTKTDFISGLKDIVKEAVKNNAFLSMVENKPEQAQDVLAKFLRHLRSSLPPSNINFIDSDTIGQAKSLLSEAVVKKEVVQAPAEDPLQKIRPLDDKSFELFDLRSREDLIDLNEEEIAKRYTAYFLGKRPKEVTTKKGTKKKEYSPFFKDTRDNPALLKQYLLSFYRLVRDVKSKAGKNGAVDRWVYSNSIDSTAESDVQNALTSASKREKEMGLDGRTSDKLEAMKQVRHALSQIKDLKSKINSKEISSKYEELSEGLNEALPSINTIEVYINDINDEIKNLGISKGDFELIYGGSISPNLSFTVPDLEGKIRSSLDNLKSVVDDKIKKEEESKKVVEEVTKEVLAAKKKKVIDSVPESTVESPKTQVPTQGDVKKTPEESLADIEEKIEKHKLTDNTQVASYRKMFKNLARVKSMDLSKLNDLINSYVDVLRTHVERNKEKFSNIDISEIDRIVKDFNDFAKVLEDLSKEQEFGFMWKGRSRLSSDAETLEESTSILKTAVFKYKKYQNDFNKFKANASALNKIEYLTQISEPGNLLDQIYKKLLSGAEATADDELNEFKEDFSSNPLKGKPIVITKTNKDGENVSTEVDALGLAGSLKSIGNSLKNIVPEKMYSKSYEILKRLSNLTDIFSFPRTEKTAYYSIIRKFAHSMVEAVRDSKGPGMLLYRQRETPYGRKFLTDVFKDDKYLQDFIAEMEKEGMGALAEHDKGQKDTRPEVGDSTKKKEDIDQTRLKEMIADKVDVEKILTKIFNKMFRETAGGDSASTDLKDKSLDDLISHFLGSSKNRSLNDLREIEKAKKDYKEAQKNLYKIDIEMGGSGADVIHEPELKELGFKEDEIKEFRKEIENLDVKGLKSVKEKEKIINEMLPIVNDPDKLIGKAVENKLKKVPTTEDLGDKVQDIVKLVDLFQKMESDFKEYAKILEDGSSEDDSVNDSDKKVSPAERFSKVKEGALLYMEMLKGGAPSTEEGKKFISSYNKLTNSKNTEFPTYAEVDTFRDKIKGLVSKDPSFKEKVRDINTFSKVIDSFFKPDPDLMRVTKTRAKERQNVIRYLGDPTWAKKVFNKQKSLNFVYTAINKKLEKAFPKATTVLPVERLEDLKNKAESDRKLRGKIRAITDESEKSLQTERLYENMLSHYDWLEEHVPLSKKAVEDLSSIVSDYDTAKKSVKNPEEQKALQEALFDSARTIMGLDEKDYMDYRIVRKELEKQEAILPKLEQEFNQLKGSRPEIEKELKKIRDRAEDFVPSLDETRHPGSELAKLRRENNALKREKLDLTKTRSDIASSPAGEKKNKKLKALDDQLEALDKKLEATVSRLKELQSMLAKNREYKSKYGSRTAASNSDMSQYDMALETRGVMPQKYEKELKSDIPFKSDKYMSQFNDVVETFSKRLKTLDKHLEGIPEEQKKPFEDEIKLYRKILKNSDSLRNTLINIGGESVPIFDSMKKLSDLVFETLEVSSHLSARRDTHLKNLMKAKEKIENLKTYVNVDTGEAKEIPKSEIDSYKKMIIKSLYRSLETYWSSYITNQLVPLGARDNEYYNKVFDFFKQSSGVKSNRKLMGILNQYKTSIRRELDDSENWDKIEELQKAKDALVKGYQRYDLDPEHSRRIKELNTRISTLTKHKKQIRNIFDEMAGLVNLETNKTIEENLRSQMEGEETSSEPKLALEEAAKQLETSVTDKLDEVIKEAPEYTFEDLSSELASLFESLPKEKLPEESSEKITKFLKGKAKGTKKTKSKEVESPETQKEEKILSEKGSVISSLEDLKEAADGVLVHAKGDNKYIFIVDNDEQENELVASGLIKPDPKGRKKGTTYKKDGKPIYDVKINMYEFPGVTSKDGDPADVWVGSNKEVKEQVLAIVNGKGGGTLFKDLVKGGGLGLPKKKEEMEVAKTPEKVPSLEKRASYRDDINFNERVLYSKTMQEKMASMLDSVLKKISDK